MQHVIIMMIMIIIIIIIIIHVLDNRHKGKLQQNTNTTVVYKRNIKYK
jgi:hypothetical protein